MKVIFGVVILYIIVYAYLIYEIQKAWTPQQTLKNLPSKLPLVSIIIAARNEEHSIEKCLQSLSLSDYPSDRFEVIVIDDMSTDKTAEIVQSHSSKNIKLFNLNKVTDKGSKKQALAYAAKIAKGEIWMYTDADCILPPNWITKCVSAYNQNKEIKIILGPVSHHDKLANWIYKWQQLDLMGMMAVTHSGVEKQKWYLGNGANLSIKASLWKDIGYALDTPHRFASGDDVTLVQRAANLDKKSIYYMLDQDFIVDTEVQPTLSLLLRQRLRWTSKNGLQSSHHQKVLMASIFIFCLFTLIVGFLILINYQYLTLFFLMIVSKALIDTLYLSKIQLFFKSNISWFWMAILSPLHTLYVAVFGLLAIVPQRYTWKGRTVT